MRKITTAIILGFFLLLPATALAVDASSDIPELNPFCWHREDCRNIRKQYLTGNPSPEELDKGFVTGGSVAPCVGGDAENPWGRCLPAGVSKTEISFGGKDEFSNIGDFILVMYKYLLTIASIVAVVMIIVAGTQWITSGGNSEAISSAKKRIGGAVIGLFIAYTSYFVLNTINPALVNLRLPQVWLIRPQELLPEFCSDIPGAKDGKLKFAYVAPAEDQKKPILPPEQRNYVSPKENDFQFLCGSRYLAESGGESTCFGDYCAEAKNTCINWDGSISCQEAIMGGKISYSSLVGTESTVQKCVAAQFSKQYVFPYVKTGEESQVLALCNSPEEGKYLIGASNNVVVQNNDPAKKTQYYKVPKFEFHPDGVCGNGAKDEWLLGFILELKLNNSCAPNDIAVFGKGAKRLGNLDIPPELEGVNYEDVLKAQGKFAPNIDGAETFSREELEKGLSLNINL